MTYTDYAKKKRGALASISGSVDASIQRQEDYIKKSRGRLITIARNNTDKHQKNKNNQKTKWVEKTVWAFQATKQAKFLCEKA